MNKLIIREIKQADFYDLDKHFGALTRYKNSISKWEGYLSDQENKKRIVRVVELENRVIGIGTLKFLSDYSSFQKNNTPEINDLIVADDKQGRGFGTALINEFEMIARDLKYKTIGLGFGLYKDYGKAQKLYIKMGYIPDGNGITFHNKPVTPGDSYPVDDDLLLWLIKSLSEES